MPDISIVIPLYNKEKYIARAVDSVLGQTIGSFELIIVNDGSTDGSIGVLEQYKDQRIKVISQENQGVSAARNRGVIAADSFLVAFLDADDEWETHMVETLLRLRNSYPQAGAYSASHQVWTEGLVEKAKVEGIPEPPWEGIIPNYFYSLLESLQTPINSSSTAIPREVFDQVGYFPVGEPDGEDIDFFCRVAIKYPVAFSTTVAVTYYTVAGSASRGILHKPFPFIETIRKEARAKRIPGHLEGYALEYACREEIYYASRRLAQGDIKLARKILLGCRTKRFKKDRTHWLLMTFEHIRPVKKLISALRYLRNLTRKISIVKAGKSMDYEIKD